MAPPRDVNDVLLGHVGRCLTEVGAGQVGGGNCAVVIDGYRETRCGARGGLLLKNGRDPRRLIVRVKPGVNCYALVTPPPGQGLDHAVRAVRCEQGAGEADPEGLKAAGPEAVLGGLR